MYMEKAFVTLFILNYMHFENFIPEINEESVYEIRRQDIPNTTSGTETVLLFNWFCARHYENMPM